jgi:hypothetical protein
MALQTILPTIRSELSREATWFFLITELMFARIVEYGNGTLVYASSQGQETHGYHLKCFAT